MGETVVPGFTSKVWHENVTYIEIRRGEGIEGGDVINIGVESQQSSTASYTSYYLAPSTMHKVNKYRLSCKIVELHIVPDEELKENVYEAEDDKMVFRKIGDAYPTVLMKIAFRGRECSLYIEVKKPGSIPYSEEKIP